MHPYSLRDEPATNPCGACSAADDNSEIVFGDQLVDKARDMMADVQEKGDLIDRRCSSSDT